VRAIDAIGFVGHRVHILREREVSTLLRWAGEELRGGRLLDLAGGDGYWARHAARLGARAVSLDISMTKSVRGQRYSDPPGLVVGDALRLPFDDGSFDVVISVCAIEHFPDGGTALDEVARVLGPGGQLVMSADALVLGQQRWPDLMDAHRRKYAVWHTYDHRSLGAMLEARGFDIVRSEYQFKGEWAEKLYLRLSSVPLGWNLAAPLAPIVARRDRRSNDEGGSVVLIHARRR